MIPIGFDPVSGTLVITDNGVFPARSLTASITPLMPDHVQINDLAGRGVQSVAWVEITSLDGSYTPLSMADALAYLQGEFAKGPVVGSPERSYALPAASGQPVFPLAPEPVDVNTVALMINGVAYYPPDTAVSPLAVTWQGPFSLEPTDALRVAYF